MQQVLGDCLGLYREVALTKEEDESLRTAYKKAIAHKSKDTKTMYKDINEIGATAVRILNGKAKIGWTTGAHSAHAVPIFAIGAGAEQFTGWHDNTEIAPAILRATR